MENRTYLCIDLKSFYASVECVERGLNPMTTNLVVADPRRTEKTICLAVTPSLKSFGISGRARLFEVVQKVGEINKKRQYKAKNHEMTGKSFDYLELKKDLTKEIDYIVASPRMKLYMDYSTRIYEIYLKYVAPEDIHVYSVDEVFIDITEYLNTYKKTPRQLAMTMIRDVLSETGITATAGIGTNMYLAKIAMDIVAKHAKADRYGVRIAELDEMSYREKLWNHTPLTDFWRVGRGYGAKLNKIGIFTMGDIARASLTRQGEDKLYKMLGVNAELLIDHAWGWEPCTMEDIRNYKPESKSMGLGQVLSCPYDFQKSRLVIREMTENLVFDLLEKGFFTKQIVLTVGYDIDNLKGKNSYKGEVTLDPYGRKIPKHAHGTTNLKAYTSSQKLICDAVLELFDKIVDKNLLVRRLNISANGIVDERTAQADLSHTQMDLFTDVDEQIKEERNLEKERSIQKTMVNIKKQYGKNAVLKGHNLEEGATAIGRNEQIGGHQK